MMGSSFTPIVLLILLGLWRHSVFADDQQNEIEDDVDVDSLLAAFSESRRLVERKREMDDGSFLNLINSNPRFRDCIEHVKEEIEKDGIPDSKISMCTGECIAYAVLQDGYGIDQPDIFPDLNCLIDGSDVKESGLVLPTKRWKLFKKIGAWWKKNKAKIIKGFVIAGKIIKGIVKLFTGK